MIMVTQEGRREMAEKSYGDTGQVLPVNKPAPDVPVETVLGMAHDLGTALGDCICMLGEISAMLIGPANEDPQPVLHVECLGEEIYAARDVAMRVRKELQRLANGLGT